MAGSPTTNALLQRVLEEVGGLAGRMDGVERRLDETRLDAREARDAGRDLKTSLETQNIPKQLAELRGEMEKGFGAARSDLANSSDKIRREIVAHDQRLTALETFKAKIDGATGFVGWISRNWVALVAIAATAAAALGWKDRV